MATINDKVYILQSGIPYEGSSIEEIFANKQTALENASNRAKEVCKNLGIEEWHISFEESTTTKSAIYSINKDGSEVEYYIVSEYVIH